MKIRFGFEDILVGCFLLVLIAIGIAIPIFMQIGLLFILSKIPLLGITVESPDGALYFSIGMIFIVIPMFSIGFLSEFVFLKLFARKEWRAFQEDEMDLEEVWKNHQGKQVYDAIILFLYFLFYIYLMDDWISEIHFSHIGLVFLTLLYLMIFELMNSEFVEKWISEQEENDQ